MSDSAKLQGNAFLLRLPLQELVSASSLGSESQLGFTELQKCCTADVQLAFLLLFFTVVLEFNNNS